MLYYLNSYLLFALVGNIPYEATEEQLKDIFSEVGLVVSFRWVSKRVVCCCSMFEMVKTVYIHFLSCKKKKKKDWTLKCAKNL